MLSPTSLKLATLIKLYKFLKNSRGKCDKHTLPLFYWWSRSTSKNPHPQWTSQYRRFFDFETLLITLLPASFACYGKIGGGDRTRTRYLLLAKQPLSQLSYTPKKEPLVEFIIRRLVGLVGLEPTTPALSRRCSNQLSYRPRSVTFNPSVNFWDLPFCR